MSSEPAVVIATLLIFPSLAVFSELEWLWEACFRAHCRHVLWIDGTVTTVSSKVTISSIAFLILKCLAIRGVALEMSTGPWTHRQHVFWILFTLTLVSCIITGSI